MTETGGNQMDQDVAPPPATVRDVPASKPLTFDPDDYRDELDGIDDLTEEQANELLLAIWEIMKAFVHLGWGVDSIHQVLPDLAAIASEIESTELQSKDNNIAGRFESVTEVPAAKEKES